MDAKKNNEVSTEIYFYQLLKEMLKTTQLTHITVSELTKQANVYRQTFYYHFKDIYDLVGKMFMYELSQIVGKYSDTSFWSLIQAVISYALENKTVLLNTIYCIDLSIVRTYTFKGMYYLIDLATRASEKRFSVDLSEEIHHELVNMLSQYLSGEILDWFASGMNTFDEKRAEIISHLVEFTLSSGLLSLADYEKRRNKQWKKFFHQSII